MNEVKVIIDQYAQEAAALRDAIVEREAALVMLVAQLGKDTISIPAGVRRRAATIEAVDLQWSNRANFLARGSLRIKVKRRREESPNGHKDRSRKPRRAGSD